MLDESPVFNAVADSRYSRSSQNTIRPNTVRIFLLGILVTSALYCLAPLLLPSLTLLSQLYALTGLTLAAFATGFATFIVNNRDHNSLFVGAGSVLAFGGALFTGVLLSALLLNSVYLISAASMLSAVSYVAAWVAPLAVPAILYPTAAVFSFLNGESLTRSLERITTNLLYIYPTKVLSALANRIQEGFYKGYDSLKNFVSGNRSETVLDGEGNSVASTKMSGGSYTQIKDTLKITKNDNTQQHTIGDEHNEDTVAASNTTQNYQSPVNDNVHTIDNADEVKTRKLSR